MKKIAKTGLLFLLILLLMPYQAFAISSSELELGKYFSIEDGSFLGFKNAELEREYLDHSEGKLYVPKKVENQEIKKILLSHPSDFDEVEDENQFGVFDKNLYKEIIIEQNNNLDRVGIFNGPGNLSKVTLEGDGEEETSSSINFDDHLFNKNSFPGLIVPSFYYKKINIGLTYNSYFYFNPSEKEKYNLKADNPSLSVIAERGRIISMDYPSDQDSSLNIVKNMRKGWYLLNPATIIIKHVDENGDPIPSASKSSYVERIIGKSYYNLKPIEKVVNPFAEYGMGPEYYYQSGGYEKNNTPKNISNYRMFDGLLDTEQEIKDFIKTHNDYPLKEVHLTKNSIENYFMLNFSFPETFSPPEIEGYMIKSQPVTVDFSKTDEFTYNPDEYVFEKEIVFTYEKIKHTVSFSLGEGAEEGQTFNDIQVKEREKTSKPKAPKAKEGYTFKGWFLGDKEYTFEEPVTGDLNLVAKFAKNAPLPKEEWTIYFTVDGNVQLTKKVEKGKTVGRPSDPERKPGHTFKGWLYNGKPWDFSKPVEKDMTLVAYFEADPDSQPKVDKSALQDLYGKVKAEKRTDYTPETWEAFAKALYQAEVILQSDLSSQDQVNKIRDQLFEAHLKLRYVKEEAPLSLKEIEKLEDITVKVGTKETEALEKLPKSIKITDSKGDTHKMPLTWKLYNYKADKPGFYNAKGSFELPKEISQKKVQKEVFIYVKVEGDAADKKFAPENFLSFEKIEDIKIYTGQEVVLPKTVKELYKDSVSRRVDVKWDTSKFDKNKAGKYSIYGSVKDQKSKPSLTIEVLERKSEDIKVRDIWGHWAEKAMAWSVKNKIFVGNEKNLFEPDRNITRGEFVSVLFRLAGEEAKYYKGAKFTDIDYNAYYDGPVEWARQKNVVAGYPDGGFGPDKPITREEQAAIMNRFLNTQGYKFEGRAPYDFKDQKKISSWAIRDVRQLQVYGLIKGKDRGVFDPQAFISRAEVAQILFNVDQNKLNTGRKNSNADPIKSGSTTPGNSVENTGKAPSTNDPSQGNTPIPQDPNAGGSQNNANSSKESKVTVSIDMKTAANNKELVSADKRHLVPWDGWVLRPTEVPIEEGESSWEVFKRVTSQYNIPISYEFTPKYNSVYIQAINGLGEFDAGENSGWMYNINGRYPDKGASLTKLRNGDRMEWRYTVSKGDGVGDFLSGF